MKETKIQKSKKVGDKNFDKGHKKPPPWKKEYFNICVACKSIVRSLLFVTNRFNSRKEVFENQKL